MSTLADLLAEPDSWSDRDALVAAIVAELGAAHGVAERIATNLADTEHARGRHHRASEAGDDVVQGIAAAIYSLELDDPPRVERYLRQTLHVASELATELQADRPLQRSAPAHVTGRRML